MQYGKWSSVVPYLCLFIHNKIHTECERRGEVSTCTRWGPRSTSAKLSMCHSESIVSESFSTFSFPQCSIKKENGPLG